MPRREDEYYSARNTVRGMPLCPFCGSVYVYPIKEKRLIFFTRVAAWSCGNEKCRMYRRRFPAPSWGSGKRG